MNQPAHPKLAVTDHPILPLLTQRWSPYAYDPRPVPPADLRACLEAARWAASSYNEQPWAFIVAPRTSEAGFQKALSCLVEANQAWAQHAGVLLLTFASRTFSRNGKPNRVAEHDLGQAVSHLSLQATALGLQAHQMGGIEIAKTRQLYSVPEGWDPVTAVALGYPAASPAGELAARDAAPRSRKPLGEFVFAERFGQRNEMV